MTVSEGGPHQQNTTNSTDYFQSFYSIERKKMLAHQRLPVHVEYLQPHISTSESKASPLALLAATCSSIGKTDAEKKDIKTTTTTPTILSKLSPSQESEKKSSFKPYKMDDKRTSPSAIMRSSPPVLVSNANIVSTKASLPNNAGSPVRSSSNRMSEKLPGSVLNTKEFEEYSRYQERMMMSRDMKCHSVSPPLPHLPSKVSMLPSMHHGPNHNHADCLHCKTGARHPHPPHPHTDILSSVRPSTAPPCSCPMCHSGRNAGDAKCHFPTHPSLPGIYHPVHKGASLPPPVMQCRDPGCTNCAKIPTSKTLQNFVHPALVHQCTHSPPQHKQSYPPPPPQAAQTPYDSYFIKNGLSPHKPKPYVCNWVFEGKHCGNNFVTSEELYQHLRSHTSLQQQRNNENEALSRATPNMSQLPPPPPSAHGPPLTPPTAQGMCNIHGCPCSAGQRKTSPRPVIPGYSYGNNTSAGLRYSPYGRPVPTGGTGIPGHGFGSHSIYHY